MNLRSVDLNLLVVFDALMAERSLTAAARRVGMSPSAMSHALQRLRATFSDPLVERTPEGMRPTQRALDLAGPLREALHELRHALEQQLEFDPARSDRTFNIRISDFLTGCLLPRVCTRVRADAPGIKLFVENIPSDITSPHRPGDIELRAAPPKLGSEYRRDRVWSDVFVVAMRVDHPAANLPMTVDQFVSLAHLRALSTGLLDDLLEINGLFRHPVVTIPSLAGVIPMLQHTDLCTVLPRQWIDLYKGLGQLATLPLPAEGVEYNVDMIWHRRDDREAGHCWLRNLIKEEFAVLYARVPEADQAGPHRLDIASITARR